MAKFAKKNGNRINLLDEIRGFCIICMVAFHAFYTIGDMFGIAEGKWLYNFFLPAEPFFAAIFIIICGISSQLSHNNLKRGLILLGAAIVISCVTYFLFPEQFIYFGILHFLSVSILLFLLLKYLINVIPTIIGLLVCAVLFFAAYPVAYHAYSQFGYFGFTGIYTIAMPRELYLTDYFAFLGFHSAGFKSADYFPVLPWIFAFLFGTFLGKYAVKKKFPKFTYKKYIPFFGLCGRYTLWIYILHQPAIFAVCWGIFKLLGH